jgi:peptidylprolyl isomerase
MKKFLQITAILFFVLAKAQNMNDILYIDLKDGQVAIEMFPELAPQHVERIKKLAKEGFYNELVFHRVIDGFMAQTGDPTGTGTGGSDLADLPAEFNDYNFGRGAIGMARTSDPNSANSQFFICFDDCSFLNGQYTVWGQVIEGMEYVDNITRGEPPRNPDQMLKVTVGSAETKNEKKQANN